MKKYFSIAMIFLILLLPGFLGSQETEETTADCCFVRDGYQGHCTVTPGEEETCESILEYLNTAGTVGKTYCNNSKLRGGWALADCNQ